MLRVKWDPNLQHRAGLYFSNLECGETFRIATTAAKGAVYMKVRNQSGVDNMLELATGKLFPANVSSLVERVPVEITIGTTKPAIY